MRVSSDMPDDVIVLHDALAKIREHRKGESLTLNLKNCGTALRFLQVHIAKCYPGESITLTGDPRLMERDGKPTTQTTSALILHGVEVPVEANESPYITMSRRIKETYPDVSLEADWSAAAFWYEYVAIHGGELLLEGLTSDSLQGDRIVADLYANYFGIQTTFTPEGAVIKSTDRFTDRIQNTDRISIDFTRCPDLYPAIALTCERLGIAIEATGTERLRYKESDRIEAVRLHEVRNDHRMAMALMAAGYPVSIEEQVCIAKSYPNFVPQHITPIKGVNDEGKGKKHALSKLIHAASSEYVWLHDDDVILPEAVAVQSGKVQGAKADLVILPLRMESENAHPSLLERLQIAEYAAIQELTMRTAKAGKAVMCSGANLIVRRATWLACEPDFHPEIPSGDDMFLLEAMKKRGYKIAVIDEPDFTAVVRPLTSWRAFFRQRMRWAGKAPQYTDKDIIRCGALVAVANILQLLCPLIILIKFPIEYSLIKTREPHTPWYVALLLEILYPFYILLSLFGGLFRQKKW
ncbi:MAG: glycosyltransferase [Paludibacteraceae bacterium]|nr:glycosyltransferase [Paludibacteraceae bacterium]